MMDSLKTSIVVILEDWSIEFVCVSYVSEQNPLLKSQPRFGFWASQRMLRIVGGLLEKGTLEAMSFGGLMRFI